MRWVCHRITLDLGDHLMAPQIIMALHFTEDHHMGLQISMAPHHDIEDCLMALRKTMGFLLIGDHLCPLTIEGHHLISKVSLNTGDLHMDPLSIRDLLNIKPPLSI